MVVVDSHSGSESDDIIETSSTSDELEEETCKNDNGDHHDDDEREGGVSEYEKQRILRIKENKERLQSLGLSILSSSLLSDSKSKKKTLLKPKGKLPNKKNNDDDEYNPSSDGEARVSSSSSEDDDEEEEEGHLNVKKARPLSNYRRGSARKGKHIQSSNTKKSSKKLHTNQNKISESDYVDDDEALIQAIALSLEGTSEASDSVLQVPQNEGTDYLADADPRKRKGKGRTKENDGRKKKAKTINSRTQMSEDQLIIHFFHFDGAGKGSITMRDLRRVAAAHDFSWTDKEIRDMIHCFDSDGDGKLSLEDFRKIVYQCNMVKIPEKTSMV